MSIGVSQTQRRRPLMSKDIQFTVREERNQKIFTFKKLESEKFGFFSLKMTQTNSMIIRIVGD